MCFSKNGSHAIIQIPHQYSLSISQKLCIQLFELFSEGCVNSHAILVHASNKSV